MSAHTLLNLIPYLLSLAITISIGWFAWQRRTTTGNTVFAILMIVEASWILGYIFELVSSTLNAKLFWDDFEFIGSLMVPILLLIYVLQYAGKATEHIWRIFTYLSVLPCIFLLLLFTNPVHGIARFQSMIEPSKPFNILTYPFTWPMWFIFIYDYIVTLTGFSILLHYLLRQHYTYRMQRIFLITGFLMPIIGGVFTLLDIKLIGQRDSSPFFFAVGNIFLAWGHFRFQLFDIAPIARDVIVETMSDLVIIMDTQNRVVDINPAACEAFFINAKSVIGTPIEHFISLKEHPEDLKIKSPDGRLLYFDLHISDLHDKKGNKIGKLWVAHNITKIKEAEISLRSIQDELETRIQERTADLSAANEALRNERDFAQHIMTTMGQGLTVTNADGVFEYVNPAFAEMLGREPEELLGITPESLTYEDDLPTLERALSDRQHLQTSSYELNLKHAKGGYIQVLITGSPRTLNGSYAGTVATVTNLTERKYSERLQSAIYQISEAAQTTQNPEDFFRLIREIVNELMPTRNLYVALYDPVNDLLNIAFQDANFRGPMVPQKLGKGITAYVLRTGLPLLATPEIFEKLVAAGKVDRLGKSKVDWLGVPLKTSKGIIGVMAAHTFSEGDRLTEKDKDLMIFVAGQVAAALERKQAEDALRVSEQRYRALARNLPNSAILLFDQNNTLVLVDGPEIEILGYTKTDLEGRKIQDVFTNELVQLIEPGIKKALHGEQSSTEIQLGQMDYLNTCLPFEVSPGNIYGMILLQNITTRKLAEAEREKLINELENKNAELERFTYTVSHDLKSPLITIRGYLGYLVHDALSGNYEQLRGDETRIVEATEKMQRLLTELLELSRIGRMVNPPTVTPFNDIVEEAANLVHGRLKERVIDLRVADNLPIILGDRERFVEVMQNLLDNASKFMGEQTDPCIEIGERGIDASGKPILFVRDNGIGIEPQYHDQIFGLFNKLDAQSEGTGVGLALVKRIIEVHKGRIWVESEGMGKGSTFCFTLPVPDR